MVPLFNCSFLFNREKQVNLDQTAKQEFKDLRYEFVVPSITAVYYRSVTRNHSFLLNWIVLVCFIISCFAGTRLNLIANIKFLS